MKFLLYIVLSWLVFRWLNRIFVGSRQRPPNQRHTPPPPRPHDSKKPNSDKIGDYVDYEELDE
jgi:hypothetical protein